MTRPTRATHAGRVYLDLQNQARATGRPTEELLVLYALEGLLDRLSVSPHAGQLVLKGGVLLAAYDARRPTRDIDLSTSDLPNDPAAVLALIRSVAAVTRDDGLVFDGGSARAETIRDEDLYSGVRVSLTAGLDRAELAVHVDVNVGDPVWPPPGPVDLPRLLGGHLTVRGYPLEMVYAEKILTVLERGTVNTRWRDFADLYLLIRRHPADGTRLTRALQSVGDHRGVPLHPLTDALPGYADHAQPRWAAWVGKRHLTDRLPTDFTTALTAVTAFAGPALSGQRPRPHLEPPPGDVGPVSTTRSTAPLTQSWRGRGDQQVDGADGGPLVTSGAGHTACSSAWMAAVTRRASRGRPALAARRDRETVPVPVPVPAQPRAVARVDRSLSDADLDVEPFHRGREVAYREPDPAAGVAIANGLGVHRGQVEPQPRVAEGRFTSADSP